MLSEANFNLVTGRWDAKTNLQTRRPGRKETPMRDLIETEGARKHSYWTIESVVLSFEDSFFPVRPNTLILRVEHAVKDWSEPFRVRPIFSGADGKQRYVLSIFWIDVWSCAAKSREEALAEITSAAPTGTPVVLDEIAFTTQFSHFQAVVSVNSLRPLNALSVLEKLNEFTWMQCSGFRPAWYSDALHGAAFDTEDALAPAEDVQEHVELLFTGPAFQRRAAAEALLRDLEAIPEATAGAARFHKWVTDAIALIFADDLERVRMNPNGDAVERRDTVARNAYRSPFWRRLRADYKVSMPVFEAKNYSEPKVDDFRQVQSYLADSHHGDLGFLVTRKSDLALDDTTLKQFRHFYNKVQPRKLIILLPSALLVGFLLDIVLGKRPRADDAMADWLEEFLLKHSYE